ncbi:hypothetical protein CHUAL_000873 [Chamberlinius hualienensis]
MFRLNRTHFWLVLILCSTTVMLAVCANGNGRRRGGNRCHEKEPLEQREQTADIVFTGTVVKVKLPHQWSNRRMRGEMSRRANRNGIGNLYNNGSVAAEIRIKRLLKGDLSFTDRTVTVTGFYDAAMCHSNIREKDTKIFMVNEVILDNVDGDSGMKSNYNFTNSSHPAIVLKLNSSLVRVTVTNLERTMAAVRGRNHSMSRFPL